MENRFPCAGLLEFPTQCIRQLIQSLPFHLANILFEVAGRIVPSKEKNADHNDKAVQKEAKEHFVSEFQIHFTLSVSDVLPRFQTADSLSCTSHVSS